MAIVTSILQRGTRAEQPDPTLVDTGTLYFVTDESVTEQSDGAAWVSYTDGGSGSGQTYTLGITVDGSGAVITTGVKGYRSIPVTGTIVSARLLADQVGDVVIDVWMDVFANYPPTDADSITAAAPPTISSDDNSEDTTLTGWTTAVPAGSVLGFNVDSAVTITRVTLELEITVP